MKPTRENQAAIINALVQNATDSYARVVKYLYSNDEQSYKDCILYLNHSIELLLKARLAQEHPLLIFKHPNASVDENSETVGMADLRSRLKNAGVMIRNEDETIISTLRKARNRIEHFDFEGTTISVDLLHKVIGFLNSFAHDELGINLGSTWRSKWGDLYMLDARIQIQNQKIEQAKALLISQGVLSFDVCCYCTHELIPLPDPANVPGETKCYLCEEKFPYASCKQCKKLFVSDPVYGGAEEGYCLGCDAARAPESHDILNIQYF
jgi:hypothetical protein